MVKLPDSSRYTLDRPACYEIRVSGRLSERWLDYFGGMAVKIETDPNNRPVTVLRGMVTDQAALQGMLQQLYSLGMPLLAVAQIKE